VKRIAAALPSFPNTTVSESFLIGYCGISSWKAHLEQISHHLLYGEGIWWKKVGSGFMFSMQTMMLSSIHRPQGPPLLHFCSTPLSDIQPARRKDWKKIVLEKNPLPVTSI